MSLGENHKREMKAAYDEKPLISIKKKTNMMIEIGRNEQEQKMLRFNAELQAPGTCSTLKRHMSTS